MREAAEGSLAEMLSVLLVFEWSYLSWAQAVTRLKATAKSFRSDLERSGLSYISHAKYASKPLRE